jgi:hypothetical protein
MALNTAAARGGEYAATESAKSRAGDFGKVHYFPTLEDGEICFARPLTDQPDLITCKQHGRVTTKPRPADWKGQNWPQFMSASCREDKIFDGVFPPHSCYVCNKMVQTTGKNAGKKYTSPARTWGLFCMREEVIGTQEMVDAGQIQPQMIGKRVGFRDKTREVDKLGADGKPTGEKILEKDVVVANMGYQNFWSGFDGAYFAHPQRTILDRDFLIRRKGKDLDTDYQVSGLDPIPGHDLRDKATAERYGEVVQAWNWDDKDPSTHRWVISTEIIEKIIEERASDEYIATFFDPDAALPQRASTGGEGQQEAAKPSNDSGVSSDDAAKVAEMASRVRGFNASQPTQESVPAASGSGMANFG